MLNKKFFYNILLVALISAGCDSLQPSASQTQSNIDPNTVASTQNGSVEGSAIHQPPNSQQDKQH